MTGEVLKDWLINKIEYERQAMLKCKDQNSCFYGMCVGAFEAYGEVLEALGLDDSE